MAKVYVSKDDVIKITANPVETKEHQDNKELAQHFRNELAKQRHDKGAIKK